MAGFTYKSYNFVDKDPIIDEILTVYQESGANYKWVQDNSGVGATTISNWFSGKTRRPQAASINAVLRSLGYKLSIAKHGEQVKIVTLVESKPRAETKPISVRHVVQMTKYKKTKGSHRG